MLTNCRVAPNSISASQLASNTITAAQIAPNAITSIQIASNAVAPESLTVALRTLLNSLSPPGTICAFGGTNIPDGWLLCDGHAVDGQKYPALFSAIGNSWGAGDGGDSGFNVPDLRGRCGIGAGTGISLSPRTLGQTGGEESHVLLLQELPAHAHGIGIYMGEGERIPMPSGSYSAGYQGERSTGNAGGNQPHNNMQPFGVVNYIIKF
jgi:microcystin-dependent protein